VIQLSFLGTKNSRRGSILDKKHRCKTVTSYVPWGSRKTQMDSNNMRLMVTNLQGKEKKEKNINPIAKDGFFTCKEMISCR